MNILTSYWELLNRVSPFPLVFDLDENKMLYLIEQNDEQAFLREIGEDNADTIVSHFNLSRLAKLDDIVSGKISLNQSQISRILGSNKLVDKVSTRNVLEQNKSKISNSTPVVSNLIGKGKHNLAPFSQRYKGDIRVVSEKIEKLIDSILAKTDKKETIEKTRLDYTLAKELAEEGNLYELIKVGEKLKVRKARQRRIQKTKEEIAKRKKLRRKLKIVGIFLIVSIVLVAIAYVGSYVQKDNSNYVVTYDTLTPAQVEELIKAYEIENDVKIWGWRRNKIHTALDSNLFNQKLFDSLINPK